MSSQRIAPQAGTVGATGPTGPLGLSGPTGTTGTAGTGITYFSQAAAPTDPAEGDLWFKTDAPSQNAVHPFLLAGM